MDELCENFNKEKFFKEPIRVEEYDKRNENRTGGQRWLEDAEKQTSNLDERVTESTKAEQRKEKRIKNETRLGQVFSWTASSKQTLCITGAPGEVKERGRKV